MSFKKFSAALSFLVVLLWAGSSTAKLASDMTLSGSLQKAYTVNPWYSYPLNCSGGVGNYTFNITEGSLPPGFFIRQDGGTFYVEGAPDTAGSYSFKLRVTDRRDCYAEKSFSFDIGGQSYKADDMTISPVFTATGQAGTWYQSTTTITGGTSGYTFNVSGTIPEGLYIRQDANRFFLEGIPSKAGTYTFTLKATDRRNSYASIKSTVKITGTRNAPSLSDSMAITGSFHTDRRINADYSSGVTVSGYNGSITWSIVSGTLPPGLSLSPYGWGNEGATLSGIPNTGGKYTFTIRATDTQNKYTEKRFTIKINDTPFISGDMTITGNLLTNRRVNEYISSAVNCETYTDTIYWGVSEGSLPPGMSLGGYSWGTVYLYGTPNKGGTYTFKLRASDKRNAYVERQFTVKINDKPYKASDISITGDFTSGRRVNDRYDSYVKVSGYTGTMSIGHVSGDLPPGLSLAKNWGDEIHLTGIPNKGGTYKFTLRATDSRNAYVERQFTVKLNGTPYEASDMSITGDLDTDKNAWVPYDSYVYAMGYTGDFNITLVNGSLPPGMFLCKSWVNEIHLAGIPIRTGRYNFRLRITDIRNAYVERTFSVTIKGNADSSFQSTTDMSLSSSLPDGYTVSNWYSGYVQVSGGTADYIHTITSGSLPPGFYVRRDGGKFYIEGIPDTAGDYTFKLRVTDQRNKFVEREFTLKIKGTPYQAQDMSASGTFPEGYGVNTWYSNSIAVSGGVREYTFNLISGSLPTRFYIRQDEGNFYLEGIPDTPGTYTFKLRFTDRRNAYTEKEYTVKINAPEGLSAGTPPTITTGKTLPAMTRRQTCNITFAATGTQPITWSRTGGTLPPGVSLTSGGKLKGILSGTGKYTFTLKAKNSVGSTSKTFTLNVTQTKLSGTLPSEIAKKGTYKWGLSVSGGAKPYTWSVSEGNLPNGLSLNTSTGKISGKPSKSGTFTFKVKVSDKNGMSNEKKFTITVTATKVTGTIPATSTRKASITWTPKASGGTAPYTWTISAGKLPDGLSINKSTGKIKGTLSKAGAFTFTVKARDANGVEGTKSFSVAVTQTSVTGSIPATATLTASYTGTPKASGGAKPYKWSVSSGKLPDGLTINPNTGEIKGKPTKAKAFSFTVKAKDANGAAGSKTYKITVTSSSAKLAITGTIPTTKPVKAPYTGTLNATGGTSPYKWSISSGKLPNGLTIAPNTGKIKGTPTKAGTFSFVVRVKDKNNTSASKVFTVRITEPEITGTLDVGFLGDSYNVPLSAKGGTSPYKWSVSSGRLPIGLELNKNNGTISGVPCEAGDFEFTVKVKDANGATGKATYLLWVIDLSASQTEDTQASSPEGKPENSPDVPGNDESAREVPNPETYSDGGNTGLNAVTGLEVLSSDVLYAGTGIDAGLVDVRAGLPLSFVIGGWVYPDGSSAEVSGVCVFVNDEPDVSITVSDEGTFTLPAEMIHGGISVTVKALAGETELETEKLNITAIETR